ncbi:MAG: hypothetical protein AAGG75_25160 [Bacteroidota bacterium]
MDYKKLILLFIGLSSFTLCLQAQKASQVLENGIRVKGDRNIFVRFDLNNSTLYYDLDRSTEDTTHPLNFNNPLEDSIIFLPSQGGINVYLMPLNPLNHIYNTNLDVIDDPIIEDANDALGEIIDQLSKVTNPAPSTGTGGTGTESFGGGDGVAAASISPSCDQEVENSKSRIKQIAELLKDSQKDKIVAIFKRLKALPFVAAQATRDSLVAINESIAKIDAHFKTVSNSIEYAQEQVKTLNTERWNCPDPFITISIIDNALKELADIQAEQEKRQQKLKGAYKLTNRAYHTANIGGGPGLSWCIPLTNIAVKKGKISLYTIKIQEGGYQLSDKNEIVETPVRDLITRTLRIRKYSLFVPERGVGIAYTAFTYNAYGTSTDSTGQQFVAEPTENEINNLNVSTMINFNIFLEHTMIHPMIQLGLGVNANIPTLLGGIGIRSNINGTRRLAVSAGFAATWIRELDQLKVGDPVTGTDDIEEDLKYKFSLPIEPYFGIQFNF